MESENVQRWWVIEHRISMLTNRLIVISPTALIFSFPLYFINHFICICLICLSIFPLNIGQTVNATTRNATWTSPRGIRISNSTLPPHLTLNSDTFSLVFQFVQYFTSILDINKTWRVPINTHKWHANKFTHAFEIWNVICNNLNVIDGIPR